MAKQGSSDGAPEHESPRSSDAPLVELRTEATSSPLDDLLKPIDIAFMMGISESAVLLEQLFTPPGEHRHFDVPYDLSTARSYFLSRCLLDVQYASFSVFRLGQHLRAERERAERPSPAATETLLVSLLTEQAIWHRRLAEGLARLILFSTTNADENFLEFLLLHEAAEANFAAKNAHADFGTDSTVLKRRAASLTRRLKEEGLGARAWYAESLAPPRPTSAASIHRSAIGIAEPLEKTALGYSYDLGFSEPSSIIHFSTIAGRRTHDADSLQLGVARILLLNACVSRRAAKLAGLESKVEAIGAREKVHTARPEPGDFVVFTLDRQNVYLAEIVRWSSQIGPFGGVRIRFVGDAPYPDVTEDEVPSLFVTPYLSRAAVIAQVRVMAQPLKDLPDSDFDEWVRHAALETWRLAFREVTLRSLAKPEP